MIQQAAEQFNNGYASAALALIVKALGCKQDVRMYRMAALYSCGARDAASAKLYLSKVPAQFQPGILQKCQLEHVDL